MIYSISARGHGERKLECVSDADARKTARYCAKRTGVRITDVRIKRFDPKIGEWLPVIELTDEERRRRVR